MEPVPISRRGFAALLLEILLPAGPDTAAARSAGKAEYPAFDLNALTLSGVILVE